MYFITAFFYYAPIINVTIKVLKKRQMKVLKAFKLPFSRITLTYVNAFIVCTFRLVIKPIKVESALEGENYSYHSFTITKLHFIFFFSINYNFVHMGKHNPCQKVPSLGKRIFKLRLWQKYPGVPL